MSWRATPYGPAFVPQQPQDPMRSLASVLPAVIDGIERKAGRPAPAVAPASTPQCGKS